MYCRGGGEGKKGKEGEREQDIERKIGRQKDEKGRKNIVNCIAQFIIL